MLSSSKNDRFKLHTEGPRWPGSLVSWWDLSSVSHFPTVSPYWNRSSRQAKLNMKLLVLVLVSLVVIHLL